MRDLCCEAIFSVHYANVILAELVSEVSAHVSEPEILASHEWAATGNIAVGKY